MSYGIYKIHSELIIAARNRARERDLNRDSGSPVPQDKVKYGRMSMEAIMKDMDYEGMVSFVKSAHNEVTRTMKDGRIICRLRETDIVTICDTQITINTGGWNTKTTRRHIEAFLARHNFQISILGVKKEGGNKFLMRMGENEVGGSFNTWATISRKTGRVYTDQMGMM